LILYSTVSTAASLGNRSGQHSHMRCRRSTPPHPAHELLLAEARTAPGFEINLAHMCHSLVLSMENHTRGGGSSPLMASLSIALVSEPLTILRSQTLGQQGIRARSS
jgi:hypothetical protein